MTGYVVHYIGGGSVGTETVPPSSTSTDITGLSGPTYAISVEATSQHLSGESEEMSISLSELYLYIYYGLPFHSFTLAHTHTHKHISGTVVWVFFSSMHGNVWVLISIPGVIPGHEPCIYKHYCIYTATRSMNVQS